MTVWMKCIETMIVNYAKAGVDSVMFPEDWGTQNTTLINPKLWYSYVLSKIPEIMRYSARVAALRYLCIHAVRLNPSFPD